MNMRRVSQIHQKRKWRIDFAFPAEMGRYREQGDCTRPAAYEGKRLEHDTRNFAKLQYLAACSLRSTRWWLSGNAVKYVNRIIRKGKEMKISTN
jgi:hypothetical protein